MLSVRMLQYISMQMNKFWTFSVTKDTIGSFYSLCWYMSSSVWNILFSPSLLMILVFVCMYCMFLDWDSQKSFVNLCRWIFIYFFLDFHQWCLNSCHFFLFLSLFICVFLLIFIINTLKASLHHSRCWTTVGKGFRALSQLLSSTGLCWNQSSSQLWFVIVIMSVRWGSDERAAQHPLGK